MKSRILILIFFAIATPLNFTQTTSAQIKITTEDKREIINQILQETNFSNALEYVPDGTLFLSTENIPVEIQNKFPIVEGVKFQFITPEKIGESEVKVRLFAFGEFKTKKNSVEIEFVEHDFPSANGRSFICRQIKGKWKIKVDKFIWSMA